MVSTSLCEAEAWAPLDARGHLDAELGHLDLLLLRELGRFEQAAQAVQSHQGIYITREEVEHLLTRERHHDEPAGGPRPSCLDDRIASSRAAVDTAVEKARACGAEPPLSALASRAGLSPAETLMLVACVAPELDRGYDRVYAYLQDDITRRRPSVDLVAGLTCTDRYERWDAVGLLSEQAPLLAQGLLRVHPDPGSPSGSSALGRLLQVAPSVVAHLLGRCELDPSLAGSARLVGGRGASGHEVHGDGAPASGAARADATDPCGRVLAHVLRIARHGPPGRSVVVHVHGAPGAGQTALVRAVAATLGQGHVEVSCPALPAPDPERAEAVRSALRDGWLSGRPVLLLDAGTLLQPQAGGTRERVLDGALARFPAVVLLTGDEPWPGGPRPDGCEIHQVRLDPLGPGDRRRHWQQALQRSGLPTGEDWAARLAGAVRLGPGDVGDVAREVQDTALGHTPARAHYDDWLGAARRRATRRLDGLARLVPAERGWADLVLDDDRTAMLHEICDHVRLRDTVLEDWGMAVRTGVARGLSVLFSGPPGTGKTMSASVVAAALGLELFAIDLSQVVSKYIGETEKNLARVFDAAEDSGAVLLIDEADALFCARTGISDAHDRYANIETSYLLQRMENYDGVAILSSNLRQNMDEAFLRRLRFVVEFPLPDVAHRRRIWERHIGGAVPVGDLDLDLLAASLPVAGGSIRNIALAAAFLAAAEGVPLGMDQLARASRREFEKLGKLWRDPLGRAAGTGVAT